MLIMAIHEADVAILMPALSGGYEKFGVRYAGLAGELALHDVDTVFVESHTSYDPDTLSFANPFTVTHEILADAAKAPVVRDLTMPPGDRPLYDPANGIRLVHHPDTNNFLASKASVFKALPDAHPKTALVTAATIGNYLSEIPGERVVVKPVRGMASQGVEIVTKQEAERLKLADGDFILQEFIDTSGGIPSLGVEGVHNIRVLSIANLAIGSIARVGGDGKDMLRHDVWGAFIGNDDLPESMHGIVNQVHEVMATLPGDGQNVIAVDLMRGINAAGEQVDLLGEVNRRPMRVSQWDIVQGTFKDERAVRELASLWDKSEAAMLAAVAGK